MCGILGSFGPSAEKLSRHFPQALQSIAHRGPDGTGIYQSEFCLLGHRRLSIVDLSESASQPMRRKQGILSYNGEIYNHSELRSTLDFIFESHSDSETLLAGLITRGTDFLDNCIGMFAGAYFSERDKSLILFRDGLGIKPLYYRVLSDSTVIFSSEIKGLLSLAPEEKRSCSSLALETYLRFENYPGHLSLFQDVSLLKPGSILRLQMKDGRVVQSSDVVKTKAKPPDGNISEAIRNAVVQSIDYHLMSDVPLGIYLSGGIDSSLVAALAARKTNQLSAFTGYFDTPDHYYDERNVTRVTARALGLPLLEVKITPGNFIQYLDNVVHALDEPKMGMGSFSQYVVAKEASLHRKVVLTGHGGDELFGGYPLFIASWLTEKGLSKEALIRLTKLKAKEWPWVLNFVASYLRSGKLQFAPDLFPQKGNLESKNIYPEFQFSPNASALELLRLYYRETYIPGLLVVEDKISMAHGIETRTPLWSQPLIEQFGDLPFETLLPRGELKGCYKKAIADLLPKEVLTAPKKGFPTPLRHWFREELYEFTRERLLCDSNPLHARFKKRDIEKLITQHRKLPLPFALDERRAHRIWMLLCLESWLRQFKVEGL